MYSSIAVTSSGTLVNKSKGFSSLILFHYLSGVARLVCCLTLELAILSNRLILLVPGTGIEPVQP